MKRRAALLLAVAAACGSPPTTVTTTDHAASRPYRDLPDIPRRAVPVELPSQYEIPSPPSPPAARRPSAKASRSAAPSGRTGRAAPLACIRSHESDTSGGYRAVSPNGLWFGAYQFDLTTWRGAVARAGHPEWVDVRPDRAPAEVQDAAARQLFAERGLQPWPPARNC